jgi:hypothetical protein
MLLKELSNRSCNELFRQPVRGFDKRRTVGYVAKLAMILLLPAPNCLEEVDLA